MAFKYPEHTALIDDLGSQLVRSHFGLTSARFYWWRQRGIPYAFRVAFAQLATIHGKHIPEDFFAPPEGKAA